MAALVRKAVMSRMSTETSEIPSIGRKIKKNGPCTFVPPITNPSTVMEIEQRRAVDPIAARAALVVEIAQPSMPAAITMVQIAVAIRTC